MIIEYFKYLTNPANTSAKKLGQLREAIAMEARYKRSTLQWTSHLENTKTLIKEACQQLSKPNEVVVLGSGLLLDIPLEFLANSFKKVYLLDVVHLKKIHQAVSKYTNVTLVEHDVTGLSSQLLNAANKESMAFEYKASIPCLSTKTNLVISANLLSQLPLSLNNYLKENCNFDEKRLHQFAIKIMQSHINLLAGLSSQVCLITDFTRIYKDTKLQLLEEESAIHDIQLPKPDKSWFWEIAPKGELGKHISMKSKVYGYRKFQISIQI